MKLMYSGYLTVLHALVFLLLEIAGQPPSSTSPTINGPRSPSGHDDHSHNRKPADATTKLPTTPSPSPSRFPAVSPVAKPIPNPPRVPTTKGKRHRGPTDSPIAITPPPTSKPSPLPTNVPTGGPTDPPTASPTAKPSSLPTNIPTGVPPPPTASPTAKPSPLPTNFPTGVPTGPPTASPTAKPSSLPTKFPTGSPTSLNPACPHTSCNDEASFSFTSATSQTGTFDATCVSSSAGVAINQCGITNANFKANFFRMYFDNNYVATVSISGATFTSSVFVFAEPNDACLGTDCPPLQGGSSQGDSSVSWVTYQDYYDVLVVVASGTPSTYTLHIDCA